MCFPNGNSAPSCNPPLCSVSSLGCYFLSHIYPGFPCCFWVSSMSPLSSGSFACVTIAAHCYAKCCAFRFCLEYWAALHTWLQSYSLTRTSQGPGRGWETPSRITMSSFIPPSARHQQNGEKCSGWMTTKMVKEMEYRIKKAERLDLFSLEKRRQRGILLPLFHLARKGYGEDGTGPFSEVHR